MLRLFAIPQHRLIVVPPLRSVNRQAIWHEISDLFDLVSGCSASHRGAEHTAECGSLIAATRLYALVRALWSQDRAQETFDTLLVELRELREALNVGSSEQVERLRSRLLEIRGLSRANAWGAGPRTGAARCPTGPTECCKEPQFQRVAEFISNCATFPGMERP